MTAARQRILVIDDEPGITNLVTSILQHEGYEVCQANTSPDIASALNENRFALVILDLMMPGLSGWDVYGQIRQDEKHRDVPVIILSARIREKEIQDALQVRRVSDYITKPFSVEDFVGRVSRAMQA